MPLQAPNLDDRRFDDIVAEARTLIPRYTPEWTDYNESDPGITLIQLFAWMSEMLLYRLNQVPERNFIEFLQLLGIELKPAQPAKAELTFTLARNGVETVIIPKGTQVAATEDGEDGPLVFETEAALIALGAELKAVQSYDGQTHRVETNANEMSGQSYHPFGPKARPSSALMLGFDAPIPFTGEQVNLAVQVHTAGLSSEGRHCDVDLAELPVPVMLVWEFWDGKYWQPLRLDKDETRAFTRSGHMFFRGPGDKVRKARMGEVDEELYWIRCRLGQGAYEVAPRLGTVATNTILATQALTVRDEVLGGSDGRPNQTFSLANAPVVVRNEPEVVTGADGLTVRITSLRLEVDTGNGFEVWQEVDDFFASGPDDPNYVLNRTTGDIRFGDGQQGRIPLLNPDNPGVNIVAREYRHGGGKVGNVGAETITEIQTFLEFVKSVSNPQPAFGGTDEETLDEAKRRAPRALKSKERAVTAEDFEFLTLETPGGRVRRAKALPLHHPKFPGTSMPGVVTVIVVPQGDAPNPMPTQATLSIVCAHLNQHRLLTSEVYVVPPTYRCVCIETDIVARPEADLAEVRRDVETRLTRYFDPLEGGEAGAGWEFGRDIFFSDVYRVVLQTPGVDRIDNGRVFIWLDGERQPFCLDVPIAPSELLYADGHDIRVAYRMRT